MTSLVVMQSSHKVRPIEHSRRSGRTKTKKNNANIFVINFLHCNAHSAAFQTKIFKQFTDRKLDFTTEWPGSIAGEVTPLDTPPPHGTGPVSTTLF